MAQLYTHASFSLPCLGVLAFGWSLLFHDYLPAIEALGWLAGTFLWLLGRGWHLRWRRARLHQTPLPVLERELFIGATITSIIWALGVLLYMGQAARYLPGRHDDALQPHSYRQRHHAVWQPPHPLWFRPAAGHGDAVRAGQWQRAGADCLLHAGGLSCLSFCRPCCAGCGGIRSPRSTTVSPTPSWWPS